jgi:hypothetical protein
MATTTKQARVAGQKRRQVMGIRMPAKILSLADIYTMLLTKELCLGLFFPCLLTLSAFCLIVKQISKSRFSYSIFLVMKQIDWGVISGQLGGSRYRKWG